jgi:hypothetical protein
VESVFQLVGIYKEPLERERERETRVTREERSGTVSMHGDVVD